MAKKNNESTPNTFQNELCLGNFFFLLYFNPDNIKPSDMNSLYGFSIFCNYSCNRRDRVKTMKCIYLHELEPMANDDYKAATHPIWRLNPKRSLRSFDIAMRSAVQLYPPTISISMKSQIANKHQPQPTASKTFNLVFSRAERKKKKPNRKIEREKKLKFCGWRYFRFGCCTFQRIFISRIKKFEEHTHTRRKLRRWSITVEIPSPNISNPTKEYFNFSRSRLTHFECV